MEPVCRISCFPARYYEREARPWFFRLATCTEPQSFRYVTYRLIAINVLVFLVQQQKGDEFTLAYAATPYEIWHNEDLDQTGREDGAGIVRDPFGRGVRIEQRPQARPHVPCPIPVRWTLLTSMFLHGSWMHLLGEHALSLDRRRQCRRSAWVISVS